MFGKDCIEYCKEGKSASTVGRSLFLNLSEVDLKTESSDNREQLKLPNALDTPEISVVVPVYNVEGYLPECLESLMNQEFSRFELILVDDGSTDSCPVICDSYALRDARIRVVHKMNGGLSSARNAGLDVARGDLIAFIDSDDIVHQSMLSTLHRMITDFDTDIAICRYKPFWGDLRFLTSDAEVAGGSSAVAVMPPAEAIASIFTESIDSVGFVAWNKLYRKSLFLDNDIRYPEGKLFEDTCTTNKLLYASRSVSVTKTTLYYYRQRRGSIASADLRNNDWYIDRLDASLCTLLFFRGKERELNELSFKLFLKTCLVVWCDLEGATYAHSIRKRIRELYEMNWVEDSDLLDEEPLKKIFYRSFLYSPWIAAVISKAWTRFQAIRPTDATGLTR